MTMMCITFVFHKSVGCFATQEKFEIEFDRTSRELASDVNRHRQYITFLPSADDACLRLVLFARVRDPVPDLLGSDVGFPFVVDGRFGRETGCRLFHIEAVGCFEILGHCLRQRCVCFHRPKNT